MSIFSSKVGHIDDDNHGLLFTDSNNSDPLNNCSTQKNCEHTGGDLEAENQTHIYIKENQDRDSITEIKSDDSENVHASECGSEISTNERMKVGDDNSIEINEGQSTLEEVETGKELVPVFDSKSETSESSISTTDGFLFFAGLLAEAVRCRENFFQNQTYFTDTESSEDEEDGDDNEQSCEREGDVQDHPSVRFTVSTCKTFAGMNIEERFEGVKVKVGQRVVRGKDWKYEKADGGEGNIGTVMFVDHEREMVIVQWDSQESLSEYRIGKDKKFDLRLYDNAQTGAKHPNYTCDGCYKSPISGIKWRCRQCEDFDLCIDCYMNNGHDVSHVFERQQEKDSMSVEVGPRKYLEPVAASGVLPWTGVRSRDDTVQKQTGFVQRYMGKKLTLYKCDVLVQIENEQHPRRYRLGREGKVDVKYTCTEDNGSTSYYEEHLPNLTQKMAKEGMRVVYTPSNNTGSILGTIIKVKKNGNKSEAAKGTNNELDVEIEVQLDDGSSITTRIRF